MHCDIVVIKYSFEPVLITIWEFKALELPVEDSHLNLLDALCPFFAANIIFAVLFFCILQELFTESEYQKQWLC